MESRTYADDESFDRAVRLHLYREFVARGSPPTVAETATALGVPADAAAASYDRLARGRVIVLRPGTEGGTREVLMASPLSAVPTRFPVRLADGRRLYGNCIWDALGIAAMLAKDVVIETTCGDDCGAPLVLEVLDGALARAEGIVHFGVPAARWWEDIVFT